MVLKASINEYSIFEYGDVMKIVLTAPASELVEVSDNPASAFISAFPKPWFIPLTVIERRIFNKIERGSDHRLIRAPLGLRRIEASLIDYAGFNRDEVGIFHPDDLEKVIDENTRIVGVSVKDPLGLAYVSLTYSTLIGMGEPMNKHEFKKLMSKILRLKKRYRFKVVVGGPGVWQLEYFTNPFKLGIDVIVDGEGDLTTPIVFNELLNGNGFKRFVKTESVPAEKIPSIKGATLYGAVEITRGCGRGCMFCSPTMQFKRSIPIENIIRDIEVNLLHGVEKTLLVTEDIFLYGSRIPWEPNDDALKKLIQSVKSLSSKGLKYIEFTHMNLAAALYRRDLTKWISDELKPYTSYKLHNRSVLATEVGIETGSPRLIEMYMKGKAKPFKPSEWPRVVLDSLILLDDLGWAPLATIIIGLPGETVEDAYHTLKLIQDIVDQGLKTFLVPLLFVPLGQSQLRRASFASFNQLADVQAEVFALCWRHNVRVWGVDYFKHMKSLDKLFFKILMKIYRVTYMNRYWWRRYIGGKVYSDILGVLK